VRLGTERFPYPSAAPSLGQHTIEVLDELGFPRDEVDRLVVEGVAVTS
jgi:crotonobetainyl-CoA:carnitine CoA-transferase CaiB-like acyl-CoA transferase